MNDQRVALIMRAGNELGGELAAGLADAKFHVALNDLLPDRLEQLTEAIKARGGSASVHTADPTRKLALQTMLQEILELRGRVDALIFIANSQPTDKVLDMDEWDWHRSLDQNLTAAFLCTQSVGRVMREIGGGVILYVLAREGKASSSYEAAAAALRGLAQAAAPELAVHNIKVRTLEVGEISPAEMVKLCTEVITTHQ